MSSGTWQDYKKHNNKYLCKLLTDTIIKTINNNLPVSSTTWQDCFDVPLVIKFRYYGISPDKIRQNYLNYAKLV